LDRSAGAIYLKLEVKAIQVASLTSGGVGWGGGVRAQKLFTLSHKIKITWSAHITMENEPQVMVDRWGRSVRQKKTAKYS